MEEIAQVAGLAKGTLYVYYDSKRELYRAALRAGLVELCDTLERAIGKAGTLAAQLEAYVTTKVAYFDENRDFFRIYLAEFGHAACGAMDPYFRDLSQRQSGLLEAAIREGLKGASGKGPLAQEAAHAVSDLTRGVILRRLMGWSSEPGPRRRSR
jgi:TetR/AcrR family fatty acid metabolism transcriptional regulator